MGRPGFLRRWAIWPSRSGIVVAAPVTVEAAMNSQGRFSAAELGDARLTYLTNYNHRAMNSGRGSAEITTVVGTSRFQESPSHSSRAR
jgi:hypothetical protein